MNIKKIGTAAALAVSIGIAPPAHAFSFQTAFDGAKAWAGEVFSSWKTFTWTPARTTTTPKAANLPKVYVARGACTGNGTGQCQRARDKMILDGGTVVNGNWAYRTNSGWKNTVTGSTDY